MSHQENIDFVRQMTKGDGDIDLADIGCGPSKHPGSVGVDVVAQAGG
jgi:hypothetical protein